MTTLPKLLLPLLLSVALLPVRAASNNHQAPQQVLSFYAFGPSNNSAEYVWQDADGKSQSLSVAGGNMSGPFQRAQAEEVLLYRIVQPDAEALKAYELKRKAGQNVAPPAPTRELARRVRLSPGMVNALVVLVMSGDRIHSTFALDQSSAALPDRTLGLRNLSAFNAALRLGSSDVLIPSQGAAQLPLSTPTGKPASTRLQFGVQKGDEWVMEEAASTVINPKRRRLALIMPVGASGATLFILPPAPSDPAAADTGLNLAKSG